MKRWLGLLLLCIGASTTMAQAQDSSEAIQKLPALPHKVESPAAAKSTPEPKPAPEPQAQSQQQPAAEPADEAISVQDLIKREGGHARPRRRRALWDPRDYDELDGDD